MAVGAGGFGTVGLSSGGGAGWLVTGSLLVPSLAPPSVDVSLSYLPLTGPDELAVALCARLRRRCVSTVAWDTGVC